MYTEGGVLRNNLISHATGATGMAIGFKEASNAVVEGNELIYCAVGIGSDLSPFQPDSKILDAQATASPTTASRSSSPANWAATSSPTTVFEGNLTSVVQAGRGKGGSNEWRGNHWDDYEGFDRDGDGRWRHALRAVRLCRSDLDRNARGPLLQDLAGAGAAGLPRASWRPSPRPN
jgi:nitrous oxidase accessory protein